MALPFVIRSSAAVISFKVRLCLGFSLDPTLRFEWALASTSRTTYRRSHDLPFGLDCARFDDQAHDQLRPMCD
jgi:hypothetical protein